MVGNQTLQEGLRRALVCLGHDVQVEVSEIDGESAEVRVSWIPWEGEAEHITEDLRTSGLIVDTSYSYLRVKSGVSRVTKTFVLDKENEFAFLKDVVHEVVASVGLSIYAALQGKELK